MLAPLTIREWRFGVFLLLVFLPGGAVLAQGSSPLPGPGGSGDRGFLFERPSVSLGLRAGLFVHRAGSDLYDFTTEKLTVDRSDFRGTSLGLEGTAWLGERTELLFGLDGSRVSLRSEYRAFLEDNGDSIQQTTNITHGPAFSAGLRWYVLPRGDALGCFIWVPRRWNAFLGGGAAFSAYEVSLEGDFVDERDLTISTAQLQSDGGAFLPFLSAGFELAMTPRVAVVLEGRYHWGDTDLGQDFQDDRGRPTFQPLDLSGARLTAGFYYRF